MALITVNFTTLMGIVVASYAAGAITVLYQKRKRKKPNGN
jgi:hypothetical protein